MTSMIDIDYPYNSQPPETTPNPYYEDSYKNYKKIQDLKEKSFKDPSTDCYNKAAWEDFQHRFDPRRGDETTIIIIDLNGLKAINDQQGHVAGDEYIKNTATYLKEVFSRRGDRVFRIGGDEFAVVCNFVKPEKRDSFNDFVNQHFNHQVLDGHNLDFSYGVSSSLPEDQSIINIINRADGLMYQNKEKWKSANPERYPKR